jgi:hypothetical protein
MPLMRQGNALLVVGGALAVDPACCCPEGSCSCCNSNTVPATITATIAGVVNNGCTGCSGVNGSYAMKYKSPCYWEADGKAIDVVCSGYTLHMSVNASLTITCDGSDTIITVVVTLIWRIAELTLTFVKVVTGKPIDCTNDIKGSYSGSATGSDDCDGSGATCNI